MAAEITSLLNPLGTRVLRDTAVTNSAVNGFTNASSTIYAIEFDNTMNSSVTYLKMYENASPTIGTTAPSFILKAAASTKEYFSMPTGMDHNTAITYLATTTQSNSSGSPSAPSNACTVNILFVP
tara:strand:- start:108 stop:482 length:375 start_codon:yes stop_codon:yes gene_type:complete